MRKPTPRAWLPLAAALLVAAGLMHAVEAGLAQDAAAQQQAEQQQAEQAGEQLGEAQPGVLSGQDVAQGVFVRDSAVAVDQFALAERLERLRDWTKAADVYQDVIARYSDLLIADRAGADGKVYQYASVGRAVQRKLAKWPDEGRDVYEQKFGTAAQMMLDDARQAQPADPDELQKLVRLYFVTDAGLDASLLLIDRHLADGSFAAARRLSRELLELHPALSQRRPEALLRAAIAAHFLGEAEQAQAHAQELAEQFPQATAGIAGQEQNLAAVAAEILASPAPAGVDLAGSGWPTFAGSEDRSRLAPPLSSQIAPYVQDLLIPETAPPDRPLSATLRRDLENDRQMGKLTGIFPVAYDGALYWSDNIHIFAVALDSGLPLPGWIDTYSGSGADLPGFTLPGGGYATPRGAALTPVVTERYLVANMGLRDEKLYLNSGNPALAAARMVCLDRLTGRSLWARMPSELDSTSLADPALQADLAECQFVGTPLVVGETVWTLAKTDPMRGRQFEQSFLVALDLADGRTHSITYLASSSGGEQTARWGQRTILPEPTSILAYSDGLIYAPTDTGAIAAVRASDGGVEWLNLYPRIEIDPLRRNLTSARLRMRSQTESQPFHAAPVIVEGGRLFFKPPDAHHVFIWNAADGAEVARVDLSVTERIGQTERVRSVDGDTTLLKVIDNLLLTFGPRGVSCIDWTAVRDGQTALEATKWSSEIRSADDEDGVMGRPAVTQTQLLLPTRQHLRVIQLEDGRFVATYPTGGAEWAQNEEPGNVIALQDQLVIAGPTRLNVYADSAVIRQRLEEQVAQNPGDPTPLLRLAQIAFVTGDFEATTQRLRQAEQAGAASDPDAVAVFSSALSFAQTLAERLDDALAPGNPTPQTVDGFFTLAEKVARSPGQHVRVRFARADFDQTEGGPQKRVALLQEILSDPVWRQVPAIPDARDADGNSSGEPQSPRQAGEVARELLAQLISESGPQVYEQIELQAGQELADAVAASDVQALSRVADIYPNSAAAQSALGEAARLLQAQDRLEEAAVALRRLAARSDNPVAAWLQLAQIEAQRPGRLEVAAGRLRRAARVSPEAEAPAIVLGEDVSVAGLGLAEAALKLTEVSLAQQAADVPDLQLPTDPGTPLFAEQPTSVAGIEAMLVPVEGYERHDRVIVRRSDGTLAAFAFDKTEPEWSVPIEPAAAHAVAWLADGLLVWGPASVSLLDGATGAVKWRHAAEVLVPGRVTAQGAAERPVVASGWRPEPSEPEAIVAAEEQREPDFQRRGGMIIRRDQIRRANQQRAENIAQARRVNELIERGEGPVQAVLADEDRAVISGVAPGSGIISVIVGGEQAGAAGIAAAGGEVRWRASLPEGELIGLHSAGDFLAVHTAASRSTLSALGLDEGSLVTRRSFELEGVEPLVNFLITPENELVFATRGKVVGVDLEKNPQGERFTIAAEPTLGENALAFGVSAGEGRMKVIGGRLLVLADPSQSGRRDALVIDLAEGAPEKFTEPATDQRHNLLLTAAESVEEDVDMDELPPRLRAQQQLRRQQARRDALRALGEAGNPGERIWSAGTSVYLSADRGLSAYDLKLPGRQWKRLNAQIVREFDPAMNLGVIIGKGHLLLLDRPRATPRREVADGAVRITSFSRDRLPDGRESGQQRHEVELAPGTHGLDAPAGNYQALDGGLAVLSESGRLIFLRAGQ